MDKEYKGKGCDAVCGFLFYCLVEDLTLSMSKFTSSHEIRDWTSVLDSYADGKLNGEWLDLVIPGSTPINRNLIEPN